MITIAQPAELFGHAIFHDHRPRHVGRLLDVVRRAGVELVLAIDQLFGDAAAETEREARLHLLHILRIEVRSEEHTSELQSLMRISYAVFCLKKHIIYKQRPTQYHT